MLAGRKAEPIWQSLRLAPTDAPGAGIQQPEGLKERDSVGLPATARNGLGPGETLWFPQRRGPSGTAFKPSRHPGNPCGTGVRADRRLRRGRRNRPNSTLRRSLRGASRGKGTAFKPCPTTPLPADVHEQIAAYEAGATINQLAADLGVHRTTVAAHLDRHQVPRHHEQTAWGRLHPP